MNVHLFQARLRRGFRVNLFESERRALANKFILIFRGTHNHWDSRSRIGSKIT